MHGEIGAEPLLLVEQLTQALAVDQLHHHCLTLLGADDVFHRVVHRNDVGVAELRYGNRFPTEAFGHHGVGRQRGFEQLDGDLASE